ncbi:DUF7511 domain-containing protein [Natronorarus salvus]|uniref:DUF7511 domain-containing protein n=1 Tax=Natronorarus salvus TaxID=3117733 RepID=UPI002F266AD2
MTTRAHATDPASSRPRVEPEPSSDHPASALRTDVVRYSGEADRCTISPRDCDDDDRLVTWISVDLEAVVDLGAVR